MNQPSRATLIAEIGGSEPIMIGELRYAVLSDTACEFAISVAEGWHGKGIGSLMLGDLQSRVRALGVESLVGDDAGICAQGRFRYRGAIRRSASGADREGYLRPANRAL